MGLRFGFSTRSRCEIQDYPLHTGMPIPQSGTQERTNMRLTLLDRQISSDLLYLDALAKKMDENPVFESNVEQYSDTVLAMLYRQKYLIGDIPISDEDIRKYYDENIVDGTPFTQDLHMSIEAVLRKQQYEQKLTTLINGRICRPPGFTARAVLHGYG